MRFGFLLLCLGLLSFSLLGQDLPGETYSLYLIGDGGEPTIENEKYRETIQALHKQNPGVPSAFVFLGDNVYPRGLENEGHRGRQEGEATLKSQARMGVGGRVFFVPGNHDWKRGRQSGQTQLMNQQAWVDSLNDSSIQFFPRDGCPGPVEIKLSENLVLVIIDSQWWLHPWDKPRGDDSSCESKNASDVLSSIEDILQRNEGSQVVVAAHHPVYTYGEHGGVFRFKDHLFPLTNVKKNFYLPLPVIGTLYPFYRTVFGSVQDIAHPEYRKFRTSIHELLKRYPGTVYASGHEHSLQYISKDSVHYVVSGSGSKSTYVKKKGYSQFARREVGFVRIAIQTNSQAKIEYYTNEATNPVFEVTSTIIPKPAAAIVGGAASQTKRVSASNQYHASKGKRKWLGENYREEWGQEIDVPVFDFQSPGGELKIVQKGGGQQTLSLRLENLQGKQYTLRSIEKYPEKAIPEAFRETFAKDLVQDQISASHPYAALAVPKLADAAGIYHTNPKVVWLDNDPRLGIYQKTFANRLMLFEERPAGDASDLDFFGNAENVVSTFKVLDKLRDDNDNHVDQLFVLRSRLFDLWIGDWDRHDDQWRWAQFDDGKGKRFRPIPRDRDQVFFVNEGRIPRLFSKRWALPKLQGFDDHLDWVSGFMFNARYFDRSFLTELEYEDWVNVARELTTSLTDDRIEEAIHEWPEEIFKLHGEEVIRKLKIRRDRLVEFAVDHYLFLAKGVDVVGSDKHELFKVEYMESGHVKVEIFKTKKDGEIVKTIYSRIFLEDETDEARLYGLDGEDRFEFVGNNKSKIKVRVIGGKGGDHLTSSAREKPMVYDKPGGLAIESGGIKDRRSNDSQVNDYNRKAFKYNQLAPLIFGNINVDDGLFLGGGFLATNHGFRKEPYKSRHLFLGSYAINTSSFNFQYKGLFTGVLGKWNGELDLVAKSPNFVNNFFGLGNESVFDKSIKDSPSVDVERSIEYYRLRFKEWTFDAKLSRKIGGSGFVRVGPTLQLVELERSDKDRFINDYETTLAEPLLEINKSFAGLSYNWGVDLRNDPILTTRGLYFEQSSKWMGGVGSSSDGDFGFHTSSFALYQSFKLPARVTFAARVTGGISRGEFQIYQSQILDGKSEIRGFRKTRFYGDSKLVFNNEVRIKIGEIHSYVLPASIGLLGFYDVGRVWYKDQGGIDPTAVTGTSSVWHKGFGGGIWLTPFNMTVVTTEIGHSVEGTLGYFRLGFLF